MEKLKPIFECTQLSNRGLQYLLFPCEEELVYVIGGSVVLFGKNRVLKLAVVNKIVRA